MELSRLASNKQATSPTGLFLVSRAEGAQKSKKSYRAIRYNFPQLSRVQPFFRSDPQVVAKGDLLGFSPVFRRGHLEKHRAQVKNGKTRFPGASGPKIKQKIWDRCPRLCYILRFARPDPQGQEIAK